MHRRDMAEQSEPSLSSPALPLALTPALGPGASEAAPGEEGAAEGGGGGGHTAPFRGPGRYST